MQHVQGYPGSHWTPPSGNYLLGIALVAARVTANKTTMKKWTNFAGHLMAVAVRRYDTTRIAQWRRSRALVVLFTYYLRTVHAFTKLVALL
jgi:hypothetical protein